MRNSISSIIAACTLLVFAVPATAQVQTMGPVQCIICDYNPCVWEDEHEDFDHPGGPWWKSPAHGGCYTAGGFACDNTHQWCNLSASAEDLERQERITEILNTMEGDERVVALVNEFPEHVQLTTGGDALEVLGAACDEARMVGRLHVTMRQAAAVIDAKASYLASK